MGLGTQDDRALAERFVDQYGPFSFPMLWDESFQSWDELGVGSQPAVALFSAEGEVIDAWLGPIPEDEVLARIAGG